MNKMILFGLIFFLALAIQGYASLTVRYNKTTNTLGNAVWNETWTSIGNKTFYMNIPKNATVVDAKLNLSGYSIYSCNDNISVVNASINEYVASMTFDGSYVWFSGQYYNRIVRTNEDGTGTTYWSGLQYGSAIVTENNNVWITSATATPSSANISRRLKSSPNVINATFSSITDSGCANPINSALAWNGTYLILFNCTSLNWLNQTKGITDGYCNSTNNCILKTCNLPGGTVTDIDYSSAESYLYLYNGSIVKMDENCNIISSSCSITGSLGMGVKDSNTVFIGTGNDESQRGIFYKKYISESAYSLNPYLDVSSDGDAEWSFTGTFNHTNNQTSDFSSEINSYLKNCYPYTDGTCDVPFILNSNSAGIMQIQLNATITYDSETYETPVIEGQNTSFWIKVNATSDITDVNAWFVWNGTSYAYTSKNNSTSYWTFTKALTVPTVSASGNVSFYWNFTYTNATSTYAQNFSSKNQYVYKFTVTNCTGGNITLNFTAYDEETQNQLNFSMDLWMSYWISSVSKKNFSYSYTGNNTYLLCLNPSYTSVYADIIVKYWNSSYGTRYYYMTNASLTNATQNISLYLLNESIGQAILFSIYNNQEYAIVGTNIAIYRQMGSDWNMVVNGITDDTGSYTFILEPTINYNIIITASGYQTKNIYLIPVLTAYKIYMTSGESNIPSFWDYWKSVTAYCNLNNETMILTCTWNDASGHLTAAHLQVTQTNNTYSSLYCDNVSSASSGVFVCPLNSNYSYVGTFYGEFGSILSKMVWDIITWIPPVVSEFGLTGLMMVFFIILTSGMFGIGLHNPFFTVVMILMGLGASIILGLVSFGSDMLAILIGLFVSGGILLFQLR